MEKPKTSLSASTAWYSAGNFFIRSISFVLIPLYSNMLTTGEYGNYALLMSLYSLAAVLYQSGMQTGLTKFYLENDQQNYRTNVFSTIFNSIAALGLFLTLISILFSKNISLLLLGNDSNQNLIIILFISLFIETLGYFSLHLLKTKELAKKVVFYSGISAVLNLGLNILFVYFMNMKVEGILWAQMLSSLIMLILIFHLILPEFRFYIDRTFLKKIVLFAFPLMFGGLLASGVDVSDRFILDFFLGKSEVGIYSLSYKIALVMNVFVISFRTAWAPYGLNLYYKKSLRETFGQTLKKLLAACLSIFLVITLLAPFLFEIKISNFYVLNKSYQSGLIILPLVLIGYLFNGLASLYSIYPLASAKSYHFLISDGLAFLVNILLNFLLIPSIGMMGAAAATCISFILAAGYLIIISEKKLKIKYPFKQIVTIIISAAIIFELGINLNNIFYEVILILVYLFIMVFVVKIKLSGMFRAA